MCFFYEKSLLSLVNYTFFLRNICITYNSIYLFMESAAEHIEIILEYRFTCGFVFKVGFGFSSYIVYIYTNGQENII